ncbi:MAG: hypothetical protein AB1427_04880 [Thermodesulfobacteriota bacterium]
MSQKIVKAGLFILAVLLMSAPAWCATPAGFSSVVSITSFTADTGAVLPDLFRDDFIMARGGKGGGNHKGDDKGDRDQDRDGDRDGDRDKDRDQDRDDCDGPRGSAHGSPPDGEDDIGQSQHGERTGK